MDVPTPSISVPVRLRIQWWGLLGLVLQIVLVGYLALRHYWGAELAARWALGAAAASAYVVSYVRVRLADNHREDEEHILPRFGAANWISFARGIAYALMAGFAFVPEAQGAFAWVPALLFLAASLADALDGYLARATNHATRLGRHADVTFDAMGLLVAILICIHTARLPVWYLAVGVVYYLFVLHRAWRDRRGLPHHTLPPSRRRGVIGGLQVGFVSVVLWPVFEPPATTLAGLVFGLPLLASFARDWLFVTGWAVRHPKAYCRLHRRAHLLFLRLVPLLARMGLTLAAAAFGWHLMAEPEGWAALAGQLGYRAEQLVMGIVGSLALLAALTAVGAAGQVASVGLLLVACNDLLLVGFQPQNAVLIVASLLVLVFGTGPASAWQPARRLILQRRSPFAS